MNSSIRRSFAPVIALAIVAIAGIASVQIAHASDEGYRAANHQVQDLAGSGITELDASPRADFVPSFAPVGLQAVSLHPASGLFSAKPAIVTSHQSTTEADGRRPPEAGPARTPKAVPTRALPVKAKNSVDPRQRL